MSRTHHALEGDEHEYILKRGQKWKHTGSEVVKVGHSNNIIHHMEPAE